MEKEKPIPKKEGTYVGLNLSKESIKLLKKFQESLGIEESFPFHITLVYSRKKINMDIKKHVNKVIRASHFHIFDNTDDGGDRALVIKFDCPYCQSRFNYAKTALGATWDYPDYEPHITLSYNWEGDIPDNILLNDFKINIESEYTEPLNLEWSDTKVKKLSKGEKDNKKKTALEESIRLKPAILATIKRKNNE